MKPLPLLACLLLLASPALAQESFSSLEYRRTSREVDLKVWIRDSGLVRISLTNPNKKREAGEQVVAVMAPREREELFKALKAADLRSLPPVLKPTSRHTAKHRRRHGERITVTLLASPHDPVAVQAWRGDVANAEHYRRLSWLGSTIEEIAQRMLATRRYVTVAGRVGRRGSAFSIHSGKQTYWIRTGHGVEVLRHFVGRHVWVGGTSIRRTETVSDLELECMQGLERHTLEATLVIDPPRRYWLRTKELGNIDVVGGKENLIGLHDYAEVQVDLWVWTRDGRSKGHLRSARETKRSLRKRGLSGSLRGRRP